jgi:YHS domain-containing protein
MTIKHAVLAFATATLLAGAATAGPVDPVFQDRKGVAIGGYDPVAYFKLSRPVKGSAQFSHSWQNATWLFQNAENRDLFKANPSQYAPQFGGYCAWAVSKGYTADTDPDAWKIVGGKLYLNYSKDVQKKWEADLNNRIREGEKNWPSLHK